MKNLKKLVTEVDNARRAVEAPKIHADIDVGDISEWNEAISAKIEEADGHVENLAEWLADRKMEAEKQERMQFEIKLHETKLKSKQGWKPKVALGNLVITKFNGSYADWPRFWGQYSETIDKTNVPPVTKFAYLRELMDFKVRKTVEALPHSAEGYNRTVSILKRPIWKGE